MTRALWGFVSGMLRPWHQSWIAHRRQKRTPPPPARATTAVLHACDPSEIPNPFLNAAEEPPWHSEIFSGMKTCPMSTSQTRQLNGTPPPPVSLQHITVPNNRKNKKPTTSSTGRTWSLPVSLQHITDVLDQHPSPSGIDHDWLQPATSAWESEGNAAMTPGGLASSSTNGLLASQRLYDE